MVVVPTTCLRYLGFLTDSVKQAYLLPADKKEKFVALRESILSSPSVSLKTLQRFAGKCVSMNLVVPAAKLYCREINAAISYCLKNSRDVPLTGSLKTEIEHWRFVDKWAGCVPWRPECHKPIIIATDASSFKYGSVVLSGRLRGLNFSDF